MTRNNTLATNEVDLVAVSAAGVVAHPGFPGLPAERLRRLQNYLFQRSDSFNYETFGTATAIEAFETRSGNCVAFTNLFILQYIEAFIIIQDRIQHSNGFG